MYSCYPSCDFPRRGKAKVSCSHRDPVPGTEHTRKDHLWIFCLVMAEGAPLGGSVGPAVKDEGPFKGRSQGLER